MRRHWFGFAAIGVVAAVAGAGLVAMLHWGGLWRGMDWAAATATLVWSLCCAAALAGFVGGRLLTTPDGDPAYVWRRAAATAVAGLGLVAAAVLAVVAGRDRDDPDVIPMSLGHYVGFATLGVVLGLVVVWVMLTLPAVNGPVLVWYGWIPALVVALELDLPEPWILLVVLAAPPLVLAGVLGFAVARRGRSVAVAAGAGVSGLMILAAAQWLVAGYWLIWLEQNQPCRVASGECRSTYLMFEVFLIPPLLVVPATVAMAGAWLGHRRRLRRTGTAGATDAMTRPARTAR